MNIGTVSAKRLSEDDGAYFMISSENKKFYACVSPMGSAHGGRFAHKHG